MIKKLLTILAIAALFVSCTGEGGKKDNVEASLSETIQSEIPTISLGEFDAKAGDYVDKEVKVEGIVDHVCKHGGKKLLLVSDEGDVHVESDKRFEDEIVGSDVVITGVVSEFKVDESYCLKMEEDNIKSHKEGETDQEDFDAKMAQIEYYRDSMKTANTDHLSYYSLEFVSLQEKEKK
jgi:hypothetical protein